MDYPRSPKIKVTIENDFKKNILRILNQPEMTYLPSMSNEDSTFSENGLITGIPSPSEKGHSFYASYNNRTYFDVFTYESKNNSNNFSLFFSRLLQSPFRVHADYDTVNDWAFDTEKYLRLIFQMCKDVLITDITVMEDEDMYYNSPNLIERIPNTLALTVGNTYLLTSAYYYIAKLLNNVLDEEEHTIFYTDQKTLAKLIVSFDYEDPRDDFYGKLAKGLDDKKRVSVFLSHHGYFMTLFIGTYNLLLVPEQPFKMKKTEDAEGIDIPFYTDLLLQMCRGIAIGDFETYFNRTN